MYRTTSGFLYISNVSSIKHSLSLQDKHTHTHAHTHTHTHLSRCSALSRGDFETSQRSSHCKMWCLMQLELRLTLWGAEIIIALVLLHHANKIHFIYTWQPSNLCESEMKYSWWNFITMAHLLFNTFSVPGALPLRYDSRALSDWDPPCSHCSELPSLFFAHFF